MVDIAHLVKLILIILLLSGCETANLNNSINGALNPIQNTQRTLSSNVYKMKVPVNNVNAQTNVIRNIPNNTKSIIETWKY
jgi:hypothetical protein